MEKIVLTFYEMENNFSTEILKLVGSDLNHSNLVLSTGLSSRNMGKRYGSPLRF
jgi:hypothetical protein